MFIIDEETGDIELIQGDSGDVVISGLPNDKAYIIYFAFIKEDKQLLGEEVSVPCQNQDTVTIHIPASFTDSLTVPAGEDFAEYYYGLKLCTADGLTEETLLIGENANPVDFNKVTVYPKRVEGNTNTNNEESE
ncbi:MAG: hypothetical protein NC311_10845 [Muribaculaceae bacterium]|nr:hypothetical protein [Muribaculaceae bacterium]